VSKWRGAGKKDGLIAAAVVLNLLAAAINLTPAKTRPLLALGRPGVLADVRFAPQADSCSANGRHHGDTLTAVNYG
jgi:hypothetical protein